MMRGIADTRTTSRRIRPPYRWLQFSVRTMLILTALAAVACWWFFRPSTNVETIAEGQLQLHREIQPRTAASGMDRFEYFDRSPWRRLKHQISAYFNHGRWQLRTAQSAVLVEGRFENDQPHGVWTTLYPTGQIAAQGTMHRGAKSVVWRTWSERGQLVSEVTYQAFQSPRGTLRLSAETDDPFDSQRQGPARVWHPTGKLKSQGAYKKDRRDGLWIFYDEEGRVGAKIEYEAGRRVSTRARTPSDDAKMSSPVPPG